MTIPRAFCRWSFRRPRRIPRAAAPCCASRSNVLSPSSRPKNCPRPRAFPPTVPRVTCARRPRPVRNGRPPELCFRTPPSLRDPRKPRCPRRTYRPQSPLKFLKAQIPSRRRAKQPRQHRPLWMSRRSRRRPPRRRPIHQNATRSALRRQEGTKQKLKEDPGMMKAPTRRPPARAGSRSAPRCISWRRNPKCQAIDWRSAPPCHSTSMRVLCRRPVASRTAPPQHRR
mmetsp:Transcript_6703/g.15192  ORF Transcript_6703/g.15192 Transcript_6703/m.15192 type:complete len:227 (-) Transcript_6703:271-951(-)